MKYVPMGVAGIGFCVLAGATQAAAVTLDFDKFKLGEGVDGYFTGGQGSFGTEPGPDLGITFHSLNNVGANAECQVVCLLGQDISKVGKAIEVDPAGLIVHIATGFSGTVEFDAAQQSGKQALFEIQTSEQVIDPPAPIKGPVIDNSAHNPPGCALQECGFVHYSFTMDPGVVGLDLDFFTFFTGMGGDVLFIDNLHFSDLNLPADNPPTAVPEAASWLAMLGGLGLLGAVRRGRTAARCAIGAGMGRPQKRSVFRRRRLMAEGAALFRPTAIDRSGSSGPDQLRRVADDGAAASLENGERLTNLCDRLLGGFGVDDDDVCRVADTKPVISEVQ
ncbi:MAG TPA: hypothetical protein VGF07_07405, partial [Stellaceae bacterium]